MGNQGFHQLDSHVADQISVSRDRLIAFKDQKSKDPRALPISHQFAAREEIRIYNQYNRAQFLRQLSWLLDEAELAYTGRPIDPKLVLGLGDFISVVAASSTEKIQERHDYLIERSGQAYIRTDIFVVGKNYLFQGEMSPGKRTIFAFYLTISAVRLEGLNPNEDSLLKSMLSPKQIYDLAREIRRSKQQG